MEVTEAQARKMTEQQLCDLIDETDDSAWLEELRDEIYPEPALEG